MMYLANQPRCPMCDMLLDAATPLDGTNAHPQPGDITVCGGCYVCLRFTEDLKLEFQPLGGLDPETRALIVKARMLLPAFKKMMGDLK